MMVTLPTIALALLCGSSVLTGFTVPVHAAPVEAAPVEATPVVNPSQGAMQRWVFRSQKDLSVLEIARVQQLLQERLLRLTGQSLPIAVSPRHDGQLLFSFRAASQTLSHLQAQALTQPISLQWKIKTHSGLWTDSALQSQFLEDVVAEYVQGQWQIRLKYKDQGVKQLAQLTRQRVGQVLGIFVGDRLISSPLIQEPILRGEAVITGQFSAEEVEQIVQDIRWARAAVALDFVGTATAH